MIHICLYCDAFIDMMCARGTGYCCNQCHKDSTDSHIPWAQPHLAT